ncbi:zinc-binding alcohol dehydrogenase family protein [Mangrovibacterium diazotrophicum]|uniref:Threonine dehydrogenase-like Zn-dependent dehydrogenase n=1 Tax=Mangrovibacterium diazotrophicum TaxID=1261403 RepID=A0A419W334_9BACT|nr:zinc-binding alcohol dehydrogenase family protein [Mangrovibacterium diazotrophicum]RKD89885.1 threonine dehydrogenase-like Zn-dependent dehydrogenase [Mangrovibacterium diazotrophicum]
MKAIEITKAGEMQLVEREMPQMAAGEILLKLKYVGFCGSDLSTYLGKNPLVQYPRIPGHEISAVIEKIGDAVPDSFTVGQSVTVVPYTNCGQCTSCKQKRFNACRYNQTLGVQRDGAMAEYITVPWQKVLKDEALSDVQLALVEPMTVGFHAVDNGKVTDLDTVMIFGCGMIGSGAIVRAKLRGATVVAVDIDDSKLAIAQQLGADYVINSKDQILHEELEKITNGDGPTVVIEAAGNPITYKSAIEEVAFAGRVVCIGYAGNEVAFPTKLWVQKEMEIMGSRNANPTDFEAVMKYLKQSSLDENVLISRTVEPEQAPQAMKDWSEAPGKILKILVKF